MIRVLAVMTVLGGCALLEKKTTVERIGHIAQGYALTCELSRWGTPEDQIATVMDYARAREELQHPGKCNEDCRLDLVDWEIGAIAGTQCPIEDR